MSASWLDELAARAPLSPELMAWARKQPDPQTAWASCERIDWILDLGIARAVDDATQRALTYAACRANPTEPRGPRIRPAWFQIAEAWALRRGVDYFDPAGAGQLVDWQNACVVVLPVAVGLLLVLQYWIHASRMILKIEGALTMPAIFVTAKLWGVARRRTAERALADYRFERVARDVFPRVRAVASRAPAPLQAKMADRFRRDWKLVSGAAS